MTYRDVTAGVAVAAALLCLLLAVPPATGSPPQRSVCEPCHEDLEYGAEQIGLPLDVVASTATMRVHSDGSATWSVTVRYADGAFDYARDPDDSRRNVSELGTDPALQRAVALRAIGGGLEPASSDHLLSVDGNASAISFSYRDPDVVAGTPAGVVLVDRYHSGGHGSGWFVDVTRLRVVGPDGTAIVNDPAGAIGDDIASTEDGALVLDGDADDPPWFSRDVYVAFAAPEPAGTIRGHLAVLLATLPTVIQTLTAVHLLGLLLLVGVLGLARWHTAERRASTGRSPRTYLPVAAVAGYLLLTLALHPPAEPPGMFSYLATVAFAAFGVVVGVVVWLALVLSSPEEA